MLSSTDGTGNINSYPSTNILKAGASRCFEHDNRFGTLEGSTALSDRIVQHAGPEPTYGLAD